MNYNFEEEKGRIVASLIDKGYKEKKITYKEFQELYEPYKNEMSEVDFAEIIGLTYSSFATFKSKGYRATILKTRYGKASEERKAEIKEILIKQGLKPKSIRYDEFLELYNPYKDEMSEMDFADILGLSNSNYKALKSGKQGARILKQKFAPLSQERRVEIREDFIKRGYSDTKIDQKTFYTLYEPYKTEISEADFATILGITYKTYNRLKNNQDAQVEILTTKMPELTPENIVRIRTILIEAGYENRSVTYEEFLTLYEPYKAIMTETKFAEILGVRREYIYNMRVRNKKVVILKPDEFDGQLERRIISDVEEKGYRNKSITYEEFLTLYEPYKEEITELNFATILGMTGSSFRTMKGGKQRATVLRTTYTGATEERKQEISNLMRTKNIENQSIVYKDFLALYEPYKIELSEVEFAELLGINQFNFQAMKNRGVKTVAFKTTYDIATDDRKAQIREAVREAGYEHRLIAYSEFLTLYSQFGSDLSEVEFADIIGINYANYTSIKNTKLRTFVLKDEYGELSAEEKEEIIELLKTSGLAESRIEYKDFLEIYADFEDKMSEADFAKLLGIGYNLYLKIKNNPGERARINFEKQFDDRVAHSLNKNRFYSKDELEALAKRYECSVIDILNSIYKDNETIVENLINTLDTQGRIFIGITKTPDWFLEKYIDRICNAIHTHSHIIGKKLHTTAHSEDIAQEILIQLLDKGDVVLNFAEDMAFDLMRRWAKVAVTHQHLSLIKSRRSNVSLDEEIEPGVTRYTRLKSKNNTEKEALYKNEIVDEQIGKETTPIDAIHICLLSGMKRKATLRYVQHKFNLTEIELINLMTDELEKKRKIKKSPNGHVYLGEEL